MTVLNPDHRITASEAIKHDFFAEEIPMQIMSQSQYLYENMN